MLWVESERGYNSCSVNGSGARLLITRLQHPLPICPLSTEYEKAHGLVVHLAQAQGPRLSARKCAGMVEGDANHREHNSAAKKIS